MSGAPFDTKAARALYEMAGLAPISHTTRPISGGGVAVAFACREIDLEYLWTARTLLPEAIDEIERLRTDLAMCRANHAAAAEHARNTCACKFDDDGNEPVQQCFYHTEQAAEIERLEADNARLRAILDFQGEPTEGPLDGIYSQYRDRIEQLERERVDKASAWDEISKKNAEIERLRAELAVWRSKQPNLDRLAHMLDACEGACPLAVAIMEIRRLRKRVVELVEYLDGIDLERGLKE